MKHRIGCVIFSLIGLAWLAFVFFDLFVHTYGDCFDEPLCNQIKNANGGLVLWRGFAVGLLICIAYAIYRRFFEDEDV
jgi:hypothetical protein